MTVFPIQSIFNRGELTPVLHSRIDLEYFKMAYKYGENFVITRHGGLMNRCGTKFLGTIKDQTKKVRLVHFIFSRTQVYALEFGHNYVRFWANDGQVMSGTPYEVATTYTEAELPELQFAQSNDVIYIAHKAHAPAKLQRFTEINWVLSNIVFIDGPYLPEPEEGSALLTHSTIASPTWAAVTRVSDGANAATLGDKDENTVYNSSAVASPSTFRFDLGVGNSAVLNNYIVVNSNDTNSNIYIYYVPRVWEIYGSNDLVSFTRLHGRTQETGWGIGEGRYFEFQNTTAFRYYEFRCLSTNSLGLGMYISEIYWGYNGDFAPTTTMTFTSTTGINGGVGLTSSDIGRHISIGTSNDVKHRWFKITGVSSDKIATGRFYGYPFRQGWHIQSYKLGAFSINSGWPACVAFYNDRLVWARTNTKPLGVYTSGIGAYENHSVSEPLVDDDAISINIASSETEEIIWMVEGTIDLIIGTSANIRTLGKGDSGRAFSPTNFQVTKQTSNGTSNITPAFAGSALIYAGYHSKVLREFLYSFEVDAYISPEVSILSDHLLKSGIVYMDFSHTPEPILWVVNGNGELIGLTYDKENKVVGLHRQRISGINGTKGYGVVETTCILPGTVTLQDDTWIVVNRTIDGGTKRYVERVTRFNDENVPKEDAWYLDSALEYNGAAVNVFAGLSHLKGLTVSVFANNTYYEGIVVSAGGTVTLPVGITATRALIGLQQSQYFDLLQPVMETPDGISFNRKKHSVKMLIDLFRTKGLKCGNIRTPEEIQYSVNGSRTTNPEELQTCFTKVHFDSRWDDSAGVRIMQHKPYPAFIRSIMLINDGEP